jgi:hypothetical protein
LCWELLVSAVQSLSAIPNARLTKCLSRAVENISASTTKKSVSLSSCYTSGVNGAVNTETAMGLSKGWDIQELPELKDALSKLSITTVLQITTN